MKALEQPVLFLLVSIVSLLLFPGGRLWLGAGLRPPDEGAEGDLPVPELQDGYTQTPEHNTTTTSSHIMLPRV